MLLDVLSKEMRPGVIILLAEEFDSFSVCVILLNMFSENPHSNMLQSTREGKDGHMSREFGK